MRKGTKHSKEVKQKIGETTKKALLRPEIREKISKARLGKKLSEKTKEKIRVANKKTYAKPEIREKIRVVLLGKPKTKEHIQKIRQTMCSSKFRKEHGQAVRKAMSRFEVKQKQIKGIVNWYNNGGKEVRVGCHNSNWKGGISKFPYPQGWTDDLKDAIRKRDGYQCQLCGKLESEIGEKLSVHHIDYIKENLNPENLTSLCRGCNAKVNFGRETWTKFFKSKLKLYMVS